MLVWNGSWVTVRLPATAGETLRTYLDAVAALAFNLSRELEKSQAFKADFASSRAAAYVCFSLQGGRFG